MDSEIIIAVIAASSAILGAVIGAVISGLVSSRTAKENRIVHAELEIVKFREQWIQRLRDALSEFQSFAMTPSLTPHLEQKFYELGTKIELMSNMKEKPFKRLNEVMYEMLEVSSGTIEEKYAKNPEFIEVSQEILKTEWDRIKSDLRYHYS